MTGPTSDIDALLTELNARFPALGTEITDAAEARRRFDALRRVPEEPTPVADVHDVVIAGPDGDELRLRWYVPEPRTDAATVMFLHGGGWVLGGLDSHDELVRKLAAATRLAFVAVDYRRAPERPFPAALLDAFAALCHVRELTGGEVVVAGDSAGANLATAVCLLARERGGPTVAGQVLLYPVTDSACDTPSFSENAEGFYITAEHLRWFWRQYAPEATDPLASPLRADLRDLPPAHVVTAALDPLRDEGEAYARRLAEAGVPTTVKRYDAFHGFLAFDAQLAVAREGQLEVCTAIRALAGALSGV